MREHVHRLSFQRYGAHYILVGFEILTHSERLLFVPRKEYANQMYQSNVLEFLDRGNPKFHQELR